MPAAPAFRSTRRSARRDSRGRETTPTNPRGRGEASFRPAPGSRSTLDGDRRASPPPAFPLRPLTGFGCAHRDSHEHERPTPRRCVWPFPAFITITPPVLRPLLTSPRRAAASRPPPSQSEHPWRPRRIRTATFPAHPPRLRNGPLMTTGFAVRCRLAQAAPPSTRFVSLGSRVRLGLPSHPTSRRRSCLRLVVRVTSSTGDSHPQAAAHAGRTTARRASSLPSPVQLLVVRDLDVPADDRHRAL
jgi:hypothetical protein